ncbi:hypothetical protein SEA_FIREMAN_43 [Microbacterium phage Fireman]|uniref:Uncharacterized protein n=3 Tax=Metamorphoovirus TaxID=2733195 RepID=A0A481VW11_9CAUD|nr:hypothetical protein HOT42_gp43 [Microbacterium phage Metamorphoo]YP_009802907.1 hypothetical protein HOT43_gp45 [Microbacterium phage RobsFeet]YP_009820278.1 hypothetical protein HOV22_gp43 [Microbacterium phage Fireman]AWY05394.1 hypothetical protein SEA_METAMORPHOO_43 [Microbacterium phage Metamorphoo]AWY06051.1 hypothetical protein SEA_ROBSFEET_44 [Microbacterium phage RobsFeet]QBI98126.1 hypothetical protein SEA_FIREMAN_43 [Microbacterium phage Fireman]
MTAVPNYLDTIPLADQAQIKQSLLDWRDAGEPHPMIPLDGDVDGDGIADAFALDAFGNLVIVPAVPITDTVSLSTGTGVETDRKGEEDG